MESILDFLANNYLYFMIGGGVLLMALIGFLVSDKKKQAKEENIEFNSVPSNETQNIPVQQQTVVPPVTNNEQNIQPEATESTFNAAEPTLENKVNEVVASEEPVLSFETEVPVETAPTQTIENVENETNEILQSGSIGEPIVAPEPEVFEMQIETPVVETPIFEEPVITEQTVEASVAPTEVVSEPFNSETIPSVEPAANEETIFEEIVEPTNIDTNVIPEVVETQTPVVEEEIIEPIFEEDNVLSEVPVETVSELEAPKIEELETFE